MLQLRNPQHIFSDRKEKRKITDRRGEKNQTRVELLRPGTVTWTAQSVSKHIRENQDAGLHEKTTSWLVPPTTTDNTLLPSPELP